MIYFTFSDQNGNDAPPHDCTKLQKCQMFLCCLSVVSGDMFPWAGLSRGQTQLTAQEAQCWVDAEVSASSHAPIVFD